MSLYEIDLDKDQEHIQPMIVCWPHVKLLDKYAAKVSKGEDFKTSVLPVEFSKHDRHDDDKCKVCKVTQTFKVRPPKRFINYDQYEDKAIHVASQIPGGNQQSDENQQFCHYCTIQKVKQDWKGVLPKI